ncbi:MAG TPA: hypothetical protein VKQ54_11460 [Caulobacteraceae bacterium]|nr:hypothetical protein [Caulobacteraceae bacterium]
MTRPSPSAARHVVQPPVAARPTLTARLRAAAVRLWTILEGLSA